MDIKNKSFIRLKISPYKLRKVLQFKNKTTNFEYVCMNGTIQLIGL